MTFKIKQPKNWRIQKIGWIVSYQGKISTSKELVALKNTKEITCKEVTLKGIEERFQHAKS
jgi:hypothetical protein